MAEKWIDVSTHSGTVDWKKVAGAGIAGAVLRAGYGADPGQQDARFAENVTGAAAAGLKIGVYWFHYADSEERMLLEWKACRKTIEPYRKNILFVASDYEYDSVRYYKERHGSEPENALVNRMVNAFLGAAKADGWNVMLYTNNDSRKNVFSAVTLAAWDLWLADYTGAPDVTCAMQQTGSSGEVPGTGGSVGTDVCFLDFGAAGSPPCTCDTSGTVTVARGEAYQALITCRGRPKVAAGTPGVVTVLHRYDDGDRHYYYFVPIGSPGRETGIYLNGGARRFIVKVK